MVKIIKNINGPHLIPDGSKTHQENIRLARNVIADIRFHSEYYQEYSREEKQKLEKQAIHLDQNYSCILKKEKGEFCHFCSESKESQ